MGCEIFFKKGKLIRANNKDHFSLKQEKLDTKIYTVFNTV